MANVKLPTEAIQQINMAQGALSQLLSGVRMGLGLPVNAIFNQQTMEFEVPEEKKEPKAEKAV